MNDFAYSLDQALVLAHYNYVDPLQPVYYRHCSEPDRGVIAQSFDGAWDHLVYVDCKLNIQDDSLPYLLSDLDKFLHNAQFVRVIHFAVDSIEQLECVHNFSFDPNTYTLVEVYLPALTHSVEHTAFIANNLLNLTRGKILQAQLLTPNLTHTIKPMQTSSIYKFLKDFDHYSYK